MVILGISIGTRTSGIALINNDGLISWNTVSFKNSWSEQKGKQILRTYKRYLKENQVSVVVLKIPRLSHHTDAILELLKDIQELIGFHGCMLHISTQNEIKAQLPDVRNSADLMTSAARLYPVLNNELRKEIASRNKYHNKMFEAVLVAHLWKQNASKKHSQ